MNKVLNNRKGFTLVELLAVIVVLAIIILVAMPNVMSAMEKARRNTFYTEATEICKIVQNAYNTDILEGNITGGTGKCYSLKDLNTSGVMDKNLKDYSGSVQILYNGDVATTKIWISNKSYQYVGADCTKLGKKIDEAVAGGADSDKLVKYSSAVSQNCGGTVPSGGWKEW